MPAGPRTGQATNQPCEQAKQCIGQGPERAKPLQREQRRPWQVQSAWLGISSHNSRYTSSPGNAAEAMETMT